MICRSTQPPRQNHLLDQLIKSRLKKRRATFRDGSHLKGINIYANNIVPFTCEAGSRHTAHVSHSEYTDSHNAPVLRPLEGKWPSPYLPLPLIKSIPGLYTK